MGVIFFWWRVEGVWREMSENEVIQSHAFSHIFTWFHTFSHIFTWFHMVSHIFTSFHTFSHGFTV